VSDSPWRRYWAAAAFAVYVAAIAGLVLGKVWVQLAAGPAAWGLRKAPVLAAA
jgi:hypothetical protein